MTSPPSSPKPSLRDAFAATFHSQLHFDEFIDIDIETEYKQVDTPRGTMLVPEERLRKILRFLNNVVFKYSAINGNVVHSYIKGKGAHTCLQAHAGSKYFFQSDINNFYGSFSKKNVRQVIEENLDQTGVADIANYKELLLKVVCPQDSLPVGFPTSPSISNSYLLNFDNEFEQVCRGKGIIFTRYSDDLILSSIDGESLVDIANDISILLSSNLGDNFSLNPNKTKSMHSGNKVKILGIVVLPTGEITVDKKIKKRLEVLLHFYINDRAKFKEYLREHYDDSVDKVSGQLAYIKAIDEYFLNKLRRRYGNFLVDSFSDRSIEK